MKKILVVEDNETNMYLITYILRDGGYKVLEAVSGEEGVDLAIKEKPDLIIMDIQLPGIDGIEATKRVRSMQVNKQIPIIALTSHAMIGDKEKAIAAGCTSYINKPIELDSFIAEIGNYIGA